MTATQLALTGRREFWPAEGEIWLVSPVCLPPARRTDADAARLAGVLPFPWTHANIAEVHDRARANYDAALGFLSGVLGRLHGQERGRRYWELVIGPWLFQYVNLLTHHADAITLATRTLARPCAIGLAATDFVTPASTLDFIYEASDDLYNLQLLTRMVEIGDVEIAERRTSAGQDRLAAQENPENLARRRPSLPARAWRRMRHEVLMRRQRAAAPRSDVVLHRSYLPPRFERRLVRATAGRVWAHAGNEFRASRSVAADAGARAQLEGFASGRDMVSEYLRRHLASDVPTVAVEQYRAMVDHAERQFGAYRPRAIFSTAAWFTDHAFGHFAGARAEAGARLVGGQHGGDFGIEANAQHLAFERSLVDRYATWGWTDPRDPGLVATPAARVVEARERRRPVSGEGILYVGTVALRFPLVARPDFSGYLELQRRFFEAVPRTLRPEFRLRMHPSDYGWGNNARFAELFPDVPADDRRRPFADALAGSRLYVCDHISTTFAEAIATNTPTVLFWDPVFFDVAPAARPYFDRARAAGFVHDTPESAARWVHEVYPAVDQWWYDEATQRTVQEFRHRFARTSPEPLRDWRQLLDGFAA